MIRGEKIVLRALEPEDAELCHRWMNDPEVTTFMGMRFPVSLPQERKWVEQERDPMQDLVLVIQIADGEAIGACSLHVEGRTAHCAGMGISLGEKKHWGQGYGTDAVLTLCGFGFAQMNLHRIFLHALAENARAIRCYEKCGFQHEGRLREAMFKHGQYRDLVVMAILEGEYAERFPERWAALTA